MARFPTVTFPTVTFPVLATVALATVALATVSLATAPPARAAADPPRATASAGSASTPAVKTAAKSRRTAVTVRPRGRGYGFLPGYEPPDRPNVFRGSSSSWIARPYGPGRRYLTPSGWQWVYGWGGARYYQGRWNGGGFGPCWTDTPIGPVWNCGR